MYLSDVDIKAKFSEMNIICDNSDYPFNLDEQIQPCSIDLRLSNVLWEPLPAESIDLRRSRLLELSPRQFWKKRILQKGEYITLKPGKFILGRTYEKFTIPSDCGGKIEGRSSFARLGLGVHCTGDFINPGYRGHMTLQLFNYCLNPIKIFPHIPICQLFLIKLSSNPSRLYGEKELQSKYMDDDGGPSYWWRDKRIKKLQNIFREVDISIQMQENILNKIGNQEPDIIERLEKYVEKSSPSNRENTEILLESFTKSEDQLRVKDKIIKGIYYTFFPVSASASLGSIFTQPFIFVHYILWGITLLSLYPFVCSLRETPKQYFGESELKNIQKNQTIS